MTEKNNIILVGDVHGWYGLLIRRIRTHHENSYIIQVGDFGLLNPDPNEEHILTALNNTLENKNCFLYVVRGNHDFPARFNQPEKFQDNFSNIAFLPDYTELTLLGKKILLIGGAISIDRKYRELNVSYWQDENVSYNPDFSYKPDYDLVVTHSCPLKFDFKKCFSNIANFLANDENLMQDMIDERTVLDKIYEKTKPKHWIFGHYHESKSSSFEETKFRCLAELEDYCFHSTLSPLHEKN
jgi:UDP-2,3-diacylglucosamine pyrophosphatase LpxH